MEIVNDGMNVPSTTSLENNNKMMVQENMQVLSPSTMIPVNDVLLSTQGEMSSFNKQQPSSIIGKNEKEEKVVLQRWIMKPSTQQIK